MVRAAPLHPCTIVPSLLPSGPAKHKSMQLIPRRSLCCRSCAPLSPSDLLLDSLCPVVDRSFPFPRVVRRTSLNVPCVNTTQHEHNCCTSTSARHRRSGHCPLICRHKPQASAGKRVARLLHIALRTGKIAAHRLDRTPAHRCSQALPNSPNSPRRIQDSALLSTFTAQTKSPSQTVRSPTVIAISCTAPFADRAP